MFYRIRRNSIFTVVPIYHAHEFLRTANVFLTAAGNGQERERSAWRPGVQVSDTMAADAYIYGGEGDIIYFHP